jgi:hypothetical protein
LAEGFIPLLILQNEAVFHLFNGISPYLWSLLSTPKSGTTTPPWGAGRTFSFRADPLGRNRLGLAHIFRRFYKDGGSVLDSWGGLFDRIPGGFSAVAAAAANSLGRANCLVGGKFGIFNP